MSHGLPHAHHARSRNGVYCHARLRCPRASKALAPNPSGSNSRLGATHQEASAMEHKRVVDLQNLADLRPVERTALTRDERLARWAEVLELDPSRRLRPLHE